MTCAAHPPNKFGAIGSACLECHTGPPQIWTCPKCGYRVAYKWRHEPGPGCEAVEMQEAAPRE